MAKRIIFIAVLFILLISVTAYSANSKLYPKAFMPEPLLGSKNAKVEVITYFGFQDPYSGILFNDTLKQIRQDYSPNEVSIRFVNRPFEFHNNSNISAYAGECANRQGSFWEYADVLFAHRLELDANYLRIYAEDLGLNMKRFDHCFESNLVIKEVQSDLDFAVDNLEIYATPTIFINDIKLVGARPYSVFKATIDAELAS